MKAIIFENHGSPDVLKYATIPTPKPARNQVLVKLHAAALNRMDLLVRAGWFGLKLDLPHILGADGAGEIVELGEGVDSFQLGDRVVINANLGCGDCDFCLGGQDNLCQAWHLLGETTYGTYAEFVLLPPKQLFRLPDEFDCHAAAASSLVYQTAWHSLITRGKLGPGEKMLIVGASGGVNTASIQIAKLTGASVIVVGSDAKKLELAESLGAEILINRSKSEKWSKEVYKLTNRKGVDVVVDNVGTTFPLSFRSLRKGGRLLTVGNTAAPKFEIDNRYIFAKHISIIGSTMGTLKDFKEVMSLIVAGKLRPVLDKKFALKDARLAHERLENNEQLGKITLSIG
ncbi:MAG: zinc-binding dehydrogenase [Anaerolineae bacterium]|mgnify:FL=1|jgi:NADPH:quinone reductase-like Zn-dependent oxidoreductase|nr:zinc-binding dehydrogenase [Anaerolineae bacterium]MBT6320902.1 zinc-binding dehydrogenase [Anaerolineae bacterium]MBT7015870.1 zinc-binding dehydrogenase [Anaerolineae bacterium]MBT7601345.1 zinc-binding dehydrogenase [Anaerolineae bacterium]MBT7776552.1 zinc-binding dehydrogenase [Anaerolineae bacterium]